MSNLSTFQKYHYILEALQAKRPLSAYDEDLLERLDISPKQLGRLFDELCGVYDNIKKEKEGKKTIYKLTDSIDLFVETFKEFDEIGWFFQMAHEADPEIFKELEAYTNQNRHLYRFKNSSFEDVATLESREVFRRLRDGVKNREYRKIKFMHDETIYDNLKCLKLILMDNNWYIAYVDGEEKLRFGRISFIEDVQYASKTGSFQPSSVAKHLAFLDGVQNSMTLFGIEPQVAKLRAMPPIAKYFEEGMKIFLPSQKYLSTEADGSVLFELTYTQPLEILPFVQRWMPDLVILEPQELIDQYTQKLSQALQIHTK